MTLLKTATLTAIATLIKITTGFIINKILAIYGGPSGLAIFGQFRDFINLINTISNGAISTGITKYIAEYRDIQRRNYIVSSSTLIALTTSAVLFITIFLFSDYISFYLLKTKEYRFVFKILSLIVFFMAFNLNIYSILNGLKKIKEYVFFNILNSLIFMLLTVLLILKFKLIGALISLVLTPFVISMILAMYIIRDNLLKKLIVNLKANRKYINKLLKYSLMSVVAATAAPISYITVRTYIGNSLGWDSAGYWQGVWFISSVYLMVVTSSLNVYYLPRLSELKNKEEIKNEIINGFKIILPITILLASLIYVAKHIIIVLLFTDKFKPMLELFKWQLIGDVIKIASWLLSYIMVAKAMTKLFIYTEIIFTASFVAFSIIGIKFFGLVGVTYAFAFNYFIYFVIMLFLNKKEGYL